MVKRFKALVFLALVGLSLGGSLAACVWEEDRGGRGEHEHGGERHDWR
jgi:hypothetical protein